MCSLSAGFRASKGRIVELLPQIFHLGSGRQIPNMIPKTSASDYRKGGGDYCRFFTFLSNHFFMDQIEDYLQTLPADRAAVLRQLRRSILGHLPDGFVETMQYGMISYVVPHSIYPTGYHCAPAEPLPFLAIAAQKSHFAMYHMGMFADDDLRAWFEQEYAQQGIGKLDMGKSCIRFKKADKIPHDLIGRLVARMGVADWIALYEQRVKR